MMLSLLSVAGTTSSATINGIPMERIASAVKAIRKYFEIPKTADTEILAGLISLNYV